VVIGFGGRLKRSISVLISVRDRKGIRSLYFRVIFYIIIRVRIIFRSRRLRKRGN